MRNLTVFLAFAFSSLANAEWKSQNTINEFTDANQFNIYTESQPVGDKGHGSMFGVQCSNGVYQVRLLNSFSLHIGNLFNDRTTEVTYRIDKENSITSKWKSSGHPSRAAYIQGSSAKVLAMQMYGKNNMILRVRPAMRDPVVIRISLKGYDRLAEKLTKGCDSP